MKKLIIAEKPSLGMEVASAMDIAAVVIKMVASSSYGKTINSWKNSV